MRRVAWIYIVNADKGEEGQKPGNSADVIKLSLIGGKNGGNTKTDIHTFTPSEGWVKAADLPSGRFQLEALVLDEGTSQVSSM